MLKSCLAKYKQIYLDFTRQGKLFKLVLTCLKLSKLVWNCSNLSRIGKYDYLNDIQSLWDAQIQLYLNMDKD